MKFCLVLCLISLFSLTVKSQDGISYLNEIKNHDLSVLWICDSIETFQDVILENNKDVNVFHFRERSEPIGFIGEHYQRLYIHLDSVYKDKRNGLDYFVAGKSMVGTNICSFKGKLKITESYKYKTSEIKEFKTGVVRGNFEFFENEYQSGSGIFKGTFYSNWCQRIGKEEIQYNALNAVSDGFCNNGFLGTWTSYKTKSSQKFSWGDSRIPNSGDLDIGTGEFYVNEKYIKFGWVSYSKAWSGNQDSQESIQARRIENQKWWIVKK